MANTRRGAGLAWDASDLPAAGVEQPNATVGHDQSHGWARTIQSIHLLCGYQHVPFMDRVDEA